MDDKALMPPPKLLPLSRPKYAPRNSQKQWRQTNATNYLLMQFEDPSFFNNSSLQFKKSSNINSSKERERKQFKGKCRLSNNVKKKKRKINENPTPPARSEWNRKDAERALAFESEYNKCKGDVQIKLELPDEPQDRDSVKRLHPNLRNVYALQSPLQRVCYISLRPDADVEKVLADLNNIPLPEFNGRCPIATLCNSSPSNDQVRPEDIDPYSLFIGNIPYNMTPKYFRKILPNRRRIEGGFSQKIKNTRYMFIRFWTLKESIDAFKKVLTSSFNSRKLIIRFKRNRNPRDRNDNESTCSSADDDEETFRFKPEFLPEDFEEPLDPVCAMEYEDSEVLDPDEYDFNEIYPAPRAPRLPLVKFLKSDDEDTDVTDYDLEKNLPIVPDDLVSNNFTESLHDLDSPFQ